MRKPSNEKHDQPILYDLNNMHAIPGELDGRRDYELSNDGMERHELEGLPRIEMSGYGAVGEAERA